MLDEENRRKILRFLGDRYKEYPDDYFPTKIMAEICGTNIDETSELCASLEKDGFIENRKTHKDNSYRIGVNGLVLLEAYSSGTAVKGTSLSQFKEIIKRGFDRMQIIDFELQRGVVEVGKKHNLNDGLYYVVMIDLAGSTLASSKMSGVAFHEWIKQFIQITKNALNGGRRNLSVFVKSIGDGALFLFRNFDDILDWKNEVDELCGGHNKRCKKEGRLDLHQYHYKTIIHICEVYFDRTNYDATAFGLNLVFKVEKNFGRGEIGITDAVRQIILQEINSGKFRINNADSYSLDENENAIIPMWKLTSLESG